jgi:chromate transport protein ChrA
VADASHGGRHHRRRAVCAARLLHFVCAELDLCALPASARDERLVLRAEAAVLALVVEALVRVAKRAMRECLHYVTAIGAFVAIYTFAVPFPWIVVGAGLIGFVVGRAGEALDAQSNDTNDYVIDRLHASGALIHVQPSLTRAMRILTVHWELCSPSG